jgi:hypothetical protein
MKISARQFEVVPVAVALRSARILEDDNSAIEGPQKGGAPATGETPEASSLKRNKDGEK